MQKYHRPLLLLLHLPSPSTTHATIQSTNHFLTNPNTQNGPKSRELPIERNKLMAKKEGRKEEGCQTFPH
jgi:hypothetical protein